MTDIFDRQPGANSLFGKKADEGGYDNLEVYRYPSEVGNDEYPHYLMFYVFTSEADLAATQNGRAVKLNTSARFSPDTQSYSGAINVGLVTGSFEVGKRMGRSLSGMLLSASGAEAAIRAAGTVEAFTVDVNSDDALEAIRGFGGQLGGIAAITATLANAPSTGVPERNLFNKAIALYMPGAPSIGYQAGWGQGDIGAGMGSVATGLETLLTNIRKPLDVPESKDEGGMFAAVGRAKAFKQKIDAYTKKGKDVLSGIGSAFSGIGQASVRAGLREADKGIFAGLGSIENALSASTRQAFNPYRVQLFTSMGFRNFSFTYKFLPKNPSEYDAVKNIITTFKTYMHPKDVRSGDLFVGYPAEFVIGYYYKDAENTELFKTGRSVLTNMSVTYGNEDFVTFRDIPGAPAEINVVMNFTEVELLDRATIREGY